MSASTTSREAHSAADPALKGVIDVDIHENWPSLDALLPYLEPQWQRHITQYGWSGVRTEMPFMPPVGASGLRMDSLPADGGPAGSDLGLMREQLLDLYDIDYALLCGQHQYAGMRGWYEFAAALASAYNDWQIEFWLEREPRLRGSVHIAFQDPEAAAREIDRVGAHPQMVQVYFPIVTHLPPAGDSMYRPIFEAIERNDLRLALHHGQMTRTPFGYQRYYVEWHTAIPQAGMSSLISLVFNGAFDRYPGLKVILLEAGFTWLPHFMSRVDQQYRELRAEVPWVKRMPTENLRERLRVSTQPMEPMTAETFLRYLELMETDEMICYSSDYPHFDFDAPSRVVPFGVSDEIRQKVLRDNALSFYGFSGS
jgi:predicted TIM-barrel fold metal-dependent hydrolase